MAAADSIQVMPGGGVLRLDGCLHATLGHHGVGITHAELGRDYGFGTVLHGDDGRRTASAASADDEDVGFKIGFAQIEQFRFDPGVALQHIGDFGGEQLTLVGADVDLTAGLRLVVWVELVQNIFAVRRRTWEEKPAFQTWPVQTACCGFQRLFLGIPSYILDTLNAPLFHRDPCRNISFSNRSSWPIMRSSYSLSYCRLLTSLIRFSSSAAFGARYLPYNPFGQHADVVLDDLGGTANGAQSAHNAVEGQIHDGCDISAFGRLNVIHDLEILRTGFGAGVAGHAAEDFWIEHLDGRDIRFDLFDVIEGFVGRG